MEITPIERSTITDQIVKQIGTFIRTGELKAGEKLPNERELAEKFETTRARVRESLRALALIGVVETHPGAGTFISKDHNIPDEAMELMFYKEQSMFAEMYEARKIIEPQIIYLALSKISEKDVNLLSENLNSCETIINQGGSPKQFMYYINRFDKIIASATDNSVLLKLMEVFVNIKKHADLKMYKVPGAMENSLKGRSKILRSLKEQNMNKLMESTTEFFLSSESFFKDIYEKDENGGV